MNPSDLLFCLYAESLLRRLLAAVSAGLDAKRAQILTLQLSEAAKEFLDFFKYFFYKTSQVSEAILTHTSTQAAPCPPHLSALVN